MNGDHLNENTPVICKRVTPWLRHHRGLCLSQQPSLFLSHRTVIYYVSLTTSREVLNADAHRPGGIPGGISPSAVSRTCHTYGLFTIVMTPTDKYNNNLDCRRGATAHTYTHTWTHARLAPHELEIFLHSNGRLFSRTPPRSLVIVMS